MSTAQMVKVTKYVEGEVISEERRRLEVWHCGGCGLLYAVDAEWAAERRSDGQGFYCPNGCSCVFRETDADRLRKQLEQERLALASTQDLLNSERRSHSATNGELTKVRRRAHAGVCPECHRTFQQVARHMKSKHPESAVSGGEPA